MPYIGKKPADIIATVIDTTTGTFSGDLTVDTNTLFVDSANNRVGVGTVSPSFPLSVQSNSNAEGLLILGRSGDDIGEIEFRENDNSTVLGELQYQQNHAVLRHRVGDLRFATGGTTERMRIDSSGNLLVGKTSANNGGTVGIELNTNDTAYFTRSGGAGVNINRTTSDGNIALFQKDGTTVGSIGTQGGTLEVGSGDVYLQFNGTNDWIKPVDGSGSNKVNVDLGTSGAKFKDLYLSGGVYLGGTGSANLLDDYEEGTFDAEIFDALSGGNQSSTSAIGYYTKIGEMVFFSFHLTGINITGLTSGNVAAFTLPFTSSSTTSKNYCAAVHVLAGDVNWAGSQTQISSFIGTSATRFQFFVQGDNESLEGVKVSEILSADFYISGQMRV